MSEVKEEPIETPPVEAGQETPTEITPVETPPEGVETPPTDEGKSGEPDGKEKTPKGVQKKIDSERRKRGAAEREAEYQKGRADELEKQAKKQPVESPPKPKAEDFDDHEEFIDKVTDWKLDERDREKDRKKAILDETPTQVKRTPEQEVLRLKMMDKIEVSKGNHDDYVEVVFEGDLSMSLTPTMFESMENSDAGAEILYHLGNNPDEADRISKLSLVAQGMAIGKLEGKISKTKTKKAPGAPEPITPISGSGASPTKAYSSMEEFASDRNKKQGL